MSSRTAAMLQSRILAGPSKGVRSQYAVATGCGIFRGGQALSNEAEDSSSDCDKGEDDAPHANPKFKTMTAEEIKKFKNAQSAKRSRLKKVNTENNLRRSIQIYDAENAFYVQINAQVQEMITDIELRFMTSQVGHTAPNASQLSDAGMNSQGMHSQGMPPVLAQSRGWGGAMVNQGIGYFQPTYPLPGNSNVGMEELGMVYGNQYS